MINLKSKTVFLKITGVILKDEKKVQRANSRKTKYVNYLNKSDGETQLEKKCCKINRGVDML